MNTNREPAYAKDGKHINIRDLKDLSRQILALVNEYDRQRSTLAWTEQEMTSLLQKCHKQELELKSLQLENFQLKK